MEQDQIDLLRPFVVSFLKTDFKNTYKSPEAVKLLMDVADIMDKEQRRRAVPLYKTASPGRFENKLFEFWASLCQKFGFDGSNHIQALREHPEFHFLRESCCSLFSCAIPCETVLSSIKSVSLGKVIEIGSGLGYFAHLLQQYGVDVIAVDNGSEKLPKHFSYFPATIRQDGAKYLLENDGCADRALFLCWSRKASQCVEHYKGDTVIVIGEKCCSYPLTDSGAWKAIESIEIPTWPGG